MRTLLVGSLGLVGTLLVGGCTGQKYVNKMLYGEDMKPHVRNDPMIMPDVPQNLKTSVAVGDLPLNVQSSFQNDYPGATVMSVTPVAMGYGRTLYKVTYIQDGTPNTVMYRGNGIPLDEPRERIFVGPEDPPLRATSKPSASASGGPF